MTKETDTMMGYHKPSENKLFHVGIDLDKRIRTDHPLRRIKKTIDFDFIYDEVKDVYGSNGNISAPPPLVLKLMLLLVFYNVRSERELMATLPERLDWLWFLGLDLDSPIPDHSVLSKARKRWGAQPFERFFSRIVRQCVNEGLVDGGKIFVDSSLVDADASNNSVIDTKDFDCRVHELEARLTEKEDKPSLPVNDRFISTTDPDASIVRRGSSKLRYQVHRSVDGKAEVITSTETTPGDVNEAHRMEALIDSHAAHTGMDAGCIVADSKYGTVENFLACHDRGIRAHITDLKKATDKRLAKKDIFGEDKFTYNSKTDTYTCPAGNTLKPKSLHVNRDAIDYGAPKKLCAVCALRKKCTDNKAGRTVKRHLRQRELDLMRLRSRSSESKRDLRTRKHLMERSFARATRYGFDRARWRGLWKVSIQEYLTCAIQNIQTLIKYHFKPKRSVSKPAQTAHNLKTTIFRASTAVYRALLASCGLEIELKLNYPMKLIEAGSW